jgi:hypothetical protein
MSDLSELLERFRRGPEILAAALTGAAGAEVDFRPDPKHWSVRQIVAHVSDSEITGHFRMRRVLAEEMPKLEAYDQNAWAENLNYSKRKYSQSLETFRRIRAENYELLKDLPPEAFDRKGMHSERGELSLLELLQIYANHAEKHALQIRRVRDAWKAAKAGATA